LLAFVNAALMGMTGLILPVFVYRHYIQDKGRFPRRCWEELGQGY
jgi:hypothetical protein